ncbi:MAG: YcaO-like family protein [Halobacteriales archaeon]
MSESPAVGVVGGGPAAEAIRAALADDDRAAADIDPADAGTAELAAVVAPAGDDRFAAVNARRAGPWIAVELGGIGGEPLGDVDAAVAVLDPGGPCYDCLTARVRSGLEERPGGRPSIGRPDARLAGAHAGRLAVDVLSGAGRVGTVVELPYAERRLLAVPNCDCEGQRPTALPRDVEAVALDETVARAEAAVDERLGPVTSVGEAESFPAPYYLATLCDTVGFSDARASRQAAGLAADWNPAFVKAVGEALERYSAGVYRASRFEVAPADGLDGAVPPARFVRPDDGFDQPDPDEPIAWLAGEALESGDRAYLPAERVVFPPPEERSGPAITTGLGLGTSGAGALVSGLTEVVERDATMLAWYSTFEPLALSVDDDGFGKLVRRARSESLDVTALLVTQDVDVPVVAAAVHRDADWPRFAAGSGAALDPTAAARAALEEALQNWTELRGMGPDRAAEEEPSLARYAAFPPAARAFVEVDRTVTAGSVGPDDPPAGAAALDTLIERVGAAGLDAYAARLTPRDVAAAGFEAVRVLVPAAQPLFTGERFFGERARSVPRELGFRPRLDRPPHPYP